MPDMYQGVILSVCSAGLAFMISLMSIPRIIYIAKRKKLFDLPDHKRKVHKEIIPNLGGVAIFMAFMVVSSFFMASFGSVKWNYLTVAIMILFVTGLRDDIIHLPPLKKMLAQLVASLIVVYWGEIRLTSMYGLFGIYGIPDSVSVLFSVVGCIFLTNAFNLIDGIDGLAGSIAVCACLLLGTLLLLDGSTEFALMSFSLMGAVMGFLRYNLSPARIFMGDSGSTVIGFILAVIAILFIDSYSGSDPFLGSLIPSAKGAVIIAFAILFVPVFDTFRVFAVRIFRGGSPFQADRIHLHHYLLDAGCSHSRIVFVLLSSNILLLSIAFTLMDRSLHTALGVLFLTGAALFLFLYIFRKKALNEKKAKGVTVSQNAVFSSRKGRNGGSVKSAHRTSSPATGKSNPHPRAEHRHGVHSS